MKTRINQMSPPTWRWLKVNEDVAEVEIFTEKSHVQLEVESEIPALDLTEEKIEEAEAVFSGTDLGIEKEWFRAFFLNQNARAHLRGSENSDALFQRRAYSAKGGHLADYHLLEAKEGETLRVQIDYTASKTQQSVTRILAGKNAKVELVKIHRAEACEEALDVVTAHVEEGASVALISVDIYGHHLATNYVMDLEGESAKGSIETVYLAGEEQKYDFLYRMNHIGKKSESDILLNGALRDKAKKIFRGTLDFRKGCAGAKGDENENVALLSPQVVSKAVPVLLCDEADVEGNHAASAGQLDEEALFYITSRGISEENAREMLLYAKLAPTLDKISDETIRAAAMKRIGETLYLERGIVE